MTSTQKGEVGLGIPQICRQTLKVLRAERGEGVKNALILWTSYKEAPYFLVRPLVGRRVLFATWTLCGLEKQSPSSDKATNLPRAWHCQTCDFVIREGGLWTNKKFL